MRRIDLYFLILAALCLITGVVMGIGMGIAHDLQFAPVHAHLNLLGWTSLALFGLRNCTQIKLLENQQVGFEGADG